MTNLTAIFGSTLGSSADSEKLLELYWDRAELKKEFANLRDQTFSLKEQIREGKGATARLQQKLDHLESLLLDPARNFGVLVHFQLRAMDQRCTELLARFAEYLKQQREQKAYGDRLRDWEREREQEKRSFVEEREDLRLEIQRLEDRLQAERYRYSMMSGLARFFRRRSTTKTLDEIAAAIGTGRQREGEIDGAIEAIESREAPDTEGLDVSAKRPINCMILSFAQQIYLHFAEDGLAALGKEAAQKDAGAINYGDREACELLLGKVSRRVASMPQPGASVETLQKRARLIAETAQFGATEDTVPIPESISCVYDFDAGGEVRKRDADLLGDDYWNLMLVLSR